MPKCVCCIFGQFFPLVQHVLSPTSIMPSQNLECMIRRLKDFYETKETSDVDFMFALREARMDDRNVWSPTYTNFAECVRAHNLGPVSRYHGFELAADMFSRRQIRIMGVNAAILLARLRQKEHWDEETFHTARQRVQDAAETYGAPPTYQWVRKALQDLCDPPPPPSSELERLRAQVVILRNDLARMRRYRNHWRHRARVAEMRSTP